MPLVAVDDVLFDAQFIEQQDTTDSEQDFLLQTVLPVAAIEGMSDGAVIFRVHVVVGVKQIEFHTPHIHTPNECMNSIVVIRDINDNLIAVSVQFTFDWQRWKHLSLIICHLLTFHRKCLGEVTITIQETDSAEVDVGV